MHVESYVWVPGGGGRSGQTVLIARLPFKTFGGSDDAVVGQCHEFRDRRTDPGRAPPAGGGGVHPLRAGGGPTRRGEPTQAGAPPVSRGGQASAVQRHAAERAVGP